MDFASAVGGAIAALPLSFETSRAHRATRVAAVPLAAIAALAQEESLPALATRKLPKGQLAAVVATAIAHIRATDVQAVDASRVTWHSTDYGLAASAVGPRARVLFTRVLTFKSALNCYLPFTPDAKSWRAIVPRPA